MLRITLKVASRTSRPFDIPLEEDEFGELRRKYWDRRLDGSSSGTVSKADEEEALKIVKDYYKGTMLKWSTHGEAVMVKAITSISLWVQGIYWYRHRTPPAAKHTRIRAFTNDNGDLDCPKCHYALIEDGELMEEPVAFSKTLQNPRFICPHCNSMVMVSQRKEAYQNQTKKQ